MTYGSQPSLVLCELWERESKAGRQYFSGYWGNLSVVLLRAGQQPHPTRPGEVVTVWRLVASERQPRDAAPKAAAKPPERDPPPDGATRPPERAARPGAPQRREGVRARQERVSAEIAAGLGVHSDADLDDEIGF